MGSTIIILLSAWLALNAAFVTICFIPARAKRDLGRYPRLVSQ